MPCDVYLIRVIRRSLAPPAVTRMQDIPKAVAIIVPIPAWIFDERHGRRLVAAIELISPANKDRPESRRVFVGKAAALLQRNVCVSLVDVVTIRDFNLYADLLEFIGGNDPALESKRPCLYAVTMRGRKRPRRRSLFESWFYPMHLGQPLPTLPIWLDVDLKIDLELESSYEETCRFLRIS
jgi:hypothetical protein